jgi:hypothetical protein
MEKHNLPTMDQHTAGTKAFTLARLDLPQTREPCGKNLTMTQCTISTIEPELIRVGKSVGNSNLHFTNNPLFIGHWEDAADVKGDFHEAHFLLLKAPPVIGDQASGLRAQCTPGLL